MQFFLLFAIAASILGSTTTSTVLVGATSIEKRFPRGWFTCDELEIIADTKAPGGDDGEEGTVYVGRSRPVGTKRATRTVAIKIVDVEDADEDNLPLPAADIIRTRFPRLDGVARIYDTCERGGEYIIVSEYMYGQTLKSLVKEGVYRGNNALVGDHIEQFLDTIRAFHQQQVALVDLHLGNLMLNTASLTTDSLVKMIDYSSIIPQDKFHGQHRSIIYILSPGKLIPKNRILFIAFTNNRRCNYW